MGLLKSGTIKDIKEKNDKYIFHFSLYRGDTNIPGNIGLIYAKSNLFEKIIFKYFIFDFDKEIDFGFFDAELIMQYNLPFDIPILYMILPNDNNKIVDKICDTQYNFEIIMDEENSIYCGLIIENNKIKRAEKLKKIKSKIDV